MRRRRTPFHCDAVSGLYAARPDAVCCNRVAIRVSAGRICTPTAMLCFLPSNDCTVVALCPWCAHSIHVTCVASVVFGRYQSEGSTRVEAPWMGGGDDGVVRCFDTGPSHESVLMDKCMDTFHVLHLNSNKTTTRLLSSRPTSTLAGPTYF
jgi:hypothetical protein